MNSKPEGSDTGGGPNQDPPGYTYSSDHRARTNRQNGRQGRVTGSAIAAEKACRITIERIESHNIFANSTSMSPLAAAPAVDPRGERLSEWLRIAVLHTY
jgi:hypothetical protein